MLTQRYGADRHLANTGYSGFPALDAPIAMPYSHTTAVGQRSKSAKRCARCRLHEADCLCAHISPIETRARLALVMHHRELDKTTATGPLALACLPNSELHVHGALGAPLDLRPLHEQGRRVLVMFPSEHARPLDAELLAEDPRPVTLVVPDGTWRQASRAARRVPGLEQAERVTLPAGPPSRWGVRREPRDDGLSTFEAIARAFGVLESEPVQRELEALFERLVDATLAARGGGGATPPRSESATAETPLPIIHQDDHLVAVHKPSGLPSHRGWARDVLPALQRVRDQVGRHLYPVHRLDRATSGVLVFALSSEVARDMQAAFARDGIAKRYLALCRGHDPQLTCVDHALSQHSGAERRPAVTDLRLLGEFERYGLYEARPRAGRTHQIRRHLKHASHPIVGDVRYGKGEHNRIFRSRFGFHRLALHCHRMAFDHPRGGGRLELEAPLGGSGEDFGALLAQLGLLAAVEPKTDWVRATPDASSETREP